MTNTTSLLRFGIIGCGALGLVHARRLSELPGVQICAVSDPDANAMQRVASAVPAPDNVNAYSNYRELLDRSELDAVVINSPNRWHVEQLLASLGCGLHVLCEKPLSMVPAEVEQVVGKTEQTGKTVAIAYQSRYRRDSRILKAALQSGQYGKVTSVNIFACEDWITPNVGTWRHDPERCPGGFFADANGHQLDLLFWLTGTEAQDVRATIENRGTPVPMVTWGEARLILQSSNGQTIENRGFPLTFMFAGDAKQWREEISIQTEKADFVLRDTRLFWSDGTSALKPFPGTESDAGASELADTPDGAFVTALRGGTPVVSPPHTVWPVLNFTLAALASARAASRR